MRGDKSLLNVKILGYDFEVFKHDWLIVIIDKDTKEKTIIVNDKEKLNEVYNKYKNDIWVGYNSRQYDQYILKGILSGLNPSYVNEQLIMKGKAGFQVVPNAKKYPLNNYDVGDILHSLKQLEGFMGSTIKESDVNFNIDRKLTTSEIEETIKYCIHDVEECLKVLEHKKGDFEAQLALIETFNLDMEMFNKTKAQLSSHILGAVKQPTLDDEFEITIPPTLILSDKYKHILDWYKNPANMSYKEFLYSDNKQHSRSLETTVAGVPHTFAWGGVHGAISNYVAEGIILCCDVASLYPSIMIEYEYLSRKLMNPNKYKEIRDERLRLKKLKDKKQEPMKIVLNSTYGILKDRNNPLFDPLMSNNVCVTGQLLLLDLIEKIEDYGTLIQSNTDGIYMLVDNMETVEKIKKIAKEWEIRTKLDLEWDIYSKIIQKDVNNYIIVDTEGKYKSKGGYVKKLSPIDYDLPIINKSLINYFVYNTPIEETINNSNDLIDYQKIVKLSSLYKQCKHGDTLLNEKVQRVFATTDINAGAITKIKIEKGIEKVEKISNTPDKCFIFNENVINVKVPNYLDKNYYVKLANERLSQFLEKTEQKVDETPNILYNCMLNACTFYDFLVFCNDNNITSKILENYIIADCCNIYGKTFRLLEFKNYFKILYGKDKFSFNTITKKITDENILNLITQNSTITKSGKSYTNFDYKTTLLEIFNIIEDKHIPINEILKKQVELFNDVRFIDNKIDKNYLYILNYRDIVAPNITTYRINDGLIELRKIKKSIYKILPLQDGDIIRVDNSQILYGLKTNGKNELGENILIADTTKQYDVITNYEIVFRDYNKNTKLISDEEV